MRNEVVLIFVSYTGVDVCTDIHTDNSTHYSVFVSLKKISELYIISKSHGSAVLKADYHCLCAIVDYQVHTTAVLILRRSAMKYTADRMVYNNSATKVVTLEVLHHTR